MTAPLRKGPLVGALALVVACAAGVGLLARSAGDGSVSFRSAGRDPDLAPALPARFGKGAVTGAPNVDLRPGTGLIATECRFSHASDDDPIVFPGDPGAAHHHNFFGNTTTDAFSTPESLAEGPTTCRLRADTAAYWAPALLRDGEPLEPVRADAYYRVAPGVDPDDVRPFPEGLMMIAGDAHAMAPQSTDIVAFACDRSRRVSSRPTECPEGATLTMRVTFPDCWNGRDADSSDHKRHVDYSGADGCPVAHPVAMPQLTFVVHWAISGPPDGLSLSPGSILNGHADFVNSWDPDKLRTEIDHCLRRGVMCQAPGGTGGSPPLFSPD